MNVLLVHAHPEDRSFNGALRDAAIAEIEGSGHSIELSDLYAMKFDPAGGPADFATPLNPDFFHYQSEQLAASKAGTFVEEIAREQDKLRRADILILQFPLWWGGPPAILKGWIDRVCAYGVTYADGTRFEAGLFKGRRALLSVTTGGTPRRFSEEGEYGEIEKVLWPIQHLFLDYLGFDRAPPHIGYAAARLDQKERIAHIAAFRARIRDLLSGTAPALPFPTPAEIAERVGNRNWSSKV